VKSMIRLLSLIVLGIVSISSNGVADTQASCKLMLCDETQDSCNSSKEDAGQMTFNGCVRKGIENTKNQIDHIVEEELHYIKLWGNSDETLGDVVSELIAQQWEFNSEFKPVRPGYLDYSCDFSYCHLPKAKSSPQCKYDKIRGSTAYGFSRATCRANAHQVEKKFFGEEFEKYRVRINSGEDSADILREIIAPQWSTMIIFGNEDKISLYTRFLTNFPRTWTESIYPDLPETRKLYADYLTQAPGD